MNITIVGATGLVGEVFLELLQAAHLPLDKLTLLAGSSAGASVKFADQDYTVQKLSGHDFAGTDVVVFCTSAELSKIYVPLAARSGALVIDLSSRFRNDAAVPLVIPEINAAVLGACPSSRVIANPNCSTAQMLLPLAPLESSFGLRSINVATYQSASGAGRQLLSSIENNDTSCELHANVIAQIDAMTDNGYTREELKMRCETQKIFARPDLTISATCVRVPVAIGHSEALSVSLNKIAKHDEIAQLISDAPGVKYAADKIHTPKQCSGRGEVFVSRLRQDLDNPYMWHMWVVADNLQKGAALNALQILEYLHKNCAWFKEHCTGRAHV